MQVPTANIFLSFDYDTIKKYFLFDKSRFTVTDLLKESKKGIDSLLFASTGNTDLVSFTHEFGEGAASLITLKLLDSNNVLFQRLLRSLIQIPDQALDLENRLLSEAGREISDIIEKNTQPSQAPDTRSPGTSANPIFGEFLQAIKEGAVKNLTDLDDLRLGTTQIFKDYAKSLIKLNRTVYIAYGIGDNLTSWVGPLKYQFHKISVDANSGKAREYTIQFAPVNSLASMKSGIDRDNIPLDNFGYGLICRGFSDPIDKEEIREAIFKNANFKTRKLQSPVDFHKIIKTTVRRYLAACCNTKEENVIVILPNLNKILGEFIDQKFNTDGRGVGILSLNSGLAAKDYIGFWNSAIDGVITAVLSELGFSCEVIPPSDRINFSISPISVARASEAKNKIDFKEKWRYNLVASLNSKFIEDPKTSYISEYQSFQIPIKNFEEGLKNRAQNKMTPMNFRLFFENDLSILALWKKHKIITDEKSPAVVFGTEDFILNAVYAEEAQLGQNNLLHESDEAFTDKEYQDSIRKLLTSTKSPSVFDGLQGLPKLFYADYNVLGLDETSIKNLQEKIKFVNESNVAIFKSGIKNSNVLEYNLIRDASFDAALQGVFIRQRTYAATNTIKHEHDKEFYKLTKSLKDFYAKFKNWVFRGKSKLDLESINKGSVNSEIKALSDEERGNTAIYQYLNSLEKKNRPVQLFYEETGSNAIALHHMFAEELMKQSFRINIKCLPYFWVNRPSDLGKPCLFVCNNPQIVGANKKIETVDFFLTNQYMINGFKHTISQNGVHSEFLLISSPRVSGTIKDTLAALKQE